jgi:hypothetical protein
VRVRCEGGVSVRVRCEGGVSVRARECATARNATPKHTCRGWWSVISANATRKVRSLRWATKQSMAQKRCAPEGGKEARQGTDTAGFGLSLCLSVSLSLSGTRTAKRWIERKRKKDREGEREGEREREERREKKERREREEREKREESVLKHVAVENADSARGRVIERSSR